MAVPILGGGTAGHPRNFTSGRPYRGINVFLLAFTAFERGFESHEWLTFRQAQEAGGTVRKGEKSTMVVFFKPYETTDRKTGDRVTVPLLRYYRLFALDQCDEITDPDAVPVPTEAPFQPVERAEAIVAAFEGKPRIEVVGTRAFYRPATDTVTMPGSARFASAESHAAVLFHELAHGVGHPSRLNREMVANPQPFGSPDYGREELIAEMSAAFLCSVAGIRPATIDNQASYLAGWVKQLRGDKRLVISAAGAAQRAADWIQNVRPGTSGTAGTPAMAEAGE